MKTKFKAQMKSPAATMGFVNILGGLHPYREGQLLVVTSADLASPYSNQPPVLEMAHDSA